MKNKLKYNKSISAVVIVKMVATLFLINTIVIALVWALLDSLLIDSEQKYMTEVIQRMSGEVGSQIDRYVDAARGMSQNYVLRNFLLYTEENANPDEKHDVYQQVGYDDVIAELNVISDLFGDTVMYVTLASVFKDDAISHLGTTGGDGFSLSTREYYTSVTEKRVYVSDVFDDYHTGRPLITVSSPVFDGDRVIGIVVIFLIVDELSSFVTDTTFGDTGSTFILDGNHNIIIHEVESYIGKNLSDLDFQGDEFLQELNQPTGTIMNFYKNGSDRIGGVANVGSLSSWKVVSAVDSSEFEFTLLTVVHALAWLQVNTLVISVLVSALSIRKALSPMEKLEEFVWEIANGNLNGTLDVESDDEIGRLADNLRYTSQTLSNYISHIDATLLDFGRGDFTLNHNIKYEGDFAAIQLSMEQFVVLMGDSFEELKTSVDHVHKGAFRMSEGAQVLASGSHEQAESVASLNHLIENINDQINETAKHSSGVNDNAKNISDELLVSNEKMLALVDSVKDIKTMSDEVKRIIKAIEDVAFQTNILALNAAIEASRAGTAGRGFAVVADEVRKLSLSTTKAVENTTVIINDIASAIESGSDLANLTSKDLQNLVQDVSHFVEKITNISLSTQDQASAIQEINLGISQIHNVIQKNNVISTESAAASEELSAQSQTMMTLIEKFKT